MARVHGKPLSISFVFHVSLLFTLLVEMFYDAQRPGTIDHINYLFYIPSVCLIIIIAVSYRRSYGGGADLGLGGTHRRTITGVSCGDFLTSDPRQFTVSHADNDLSALTLVCPGRPTWPHISTAFCLLPALW